MRIDMKRKLFTIISSLLLGCISQVAYAQQIDDDYSHGLQLLETGEYKEALKYLGKSAKEGSSQAQYTIGMMYLEGKGMKTNPEDAAYWFRKAAQNGHAPSQLQIGNCFAEGIGVQPDQRIAAEWYWRAAEGGNPVAALYVARAYRDGKGMQQDMGRARKYFRMAADAGIAEADEELKALPASADATTPKKVQKKSSAHQPRK